MLLSLLSSFAILAAPLAQASPLWRGLATFDSTLTKRAAFNEDKPTLTLPKNYTAEVTIHDSCSAAQTMLLKRGFAEMKELATYAQERILALGEFDPSYVRYFGNASSATAAGYYAQIAYGAKTGVLFRCDDPDRNCATQTTEEGPWAGHWRGENATLETVICPPTFNITNRVSLYELCWDGKKVGPGNPAHYLGADLMHRLTHVPMVAFEHVVHAAEELSDILALAASNNSLAAMNTDSLALYALDVFARDIAHPPYGCTYNLSAASNTSSRA